MVQWTHVEATGDRGARPTPLPLSVPLCERLRLRWLAQSALQP